MVAVLQADKAIYRLIGPGLATTDADPANPRVRSFTRAEAKALNGSRADGRRWVLDPGAEPGEITDHKPDYAPGEFEKRFSDGLRKDAVNFKAARIQQEAIMASSSKAARSDWNGLSQCQVIRFCGSKGLDKVRVRAICERIGLKPADGTISIQLGKGRMKEALPTLDDKIAAELLGDHAPAVKLTKSEKRARRAERRAAKAAEAVTV